MIVTANFTIDQFSTNKVISYAFGGKNGQKAILLNSTNLVIPFDGILTGDLSVTQPNNGNSPWPNLLANLMNGKQDVIADGYAAGLQLCKYDTKKGMQESVFFGFTGVIPLELSYNKQASQSTETLTVHFNQVKVEYYPPSKY